jgi:GNAT superfamily N-acetyltransferase
MRSSKADDFRYKIVHCKNAMFAEHIFRMECAEYQERCLPLNFIRTAICSKAFRFVIAFGEYGNSIGYGIARKMSQSGIHLMRVVVDHNFQRCGVGTAIIETLHKGTKWDMQTIVDERHLQDQLFLKACGFVCYEIKQNVFDGNDGYVMTRSKTSGVLFPLAS